MVSKFEKLLLSQDIFGQPISVNYRGYDHYKTKLGGCLSIITYLVMLTNLVVLIQSFLDGSKQNEIVQTEKYDRFMSGKISLPESLY